MSLCRCRTPSPTAVRLRCWAASRLWGVCPDQIKPCSPRMISRCYQLKAEIHPMLFDTPVSISEGSSWLPEMARHILLSLSKLGFWGPGFLKARCTSTALVEGWLQSKSNQGWLYRLIGWFLTDLTSMHVSQIQSLSVYVPPRTWLLGARVDILTGAIHHSSAPEREKRCRKCSFVRKAGGHCHPTIWEACWLLE